MAFLWVDENNKKYQNVLASICLEKIEKKCSRGQLLLK